MDPEALRETLSNYMKTEENIEGGTTEHGDWEPLVSISITEYERLMCVAEDVQAIVNDLDESIVNKLASSNPRGMHVPYHGDFCSAPPSVMKDLGRLSQRLRDALGDVK